MRGPFPIGRGNVRLACLFGDGGDGPGIAEHVGVDRRTFALSAMIAPADGDLHAVAIVDLPEKPVGFQTRFLPFLIVGDQVGQQVDGAVEIAENDGALKHRIRSPEAVAAGRAAFAEPENGVIVEVLRIADPAAFAEVVSGRARDGVVFSTPRDLRKKLRDNKAVGSFLDVFAERPPAEVIGFLDLFVRAIEERDIFRHPVRRHLIGNGLAKMCVVEAVEIFHIAAHGIRAENGGRA